MGGGRLGYEPSERTETRLLTAQVVHDNSSFYLSGPWASKGWEPLLYTEKASITASLPQDVLLTWLHQHRKVG